MLNGLFYVCLNKALPNSNNSHIKFAYLLFSLTDNGF